MFSFLVHIFPILAIVFYFSATVVYVLFLFRGTEEGALILGRRALGAGLVLHLGFLGVGASSGFHFVTASDVPVSLSLLSCSLIATFLLIERRAKITALGAFLAPLGTVFLLFSGVLFHVERETQDAGSFGLLLQTHIGTAVAANALFVFAFVVSLALIIQESLLKKRRFTLLQQKLPSVATLDILNFRLLLFGFFLMCAGVLSGIVFAFTNQMNLFAFDPRLFWSFLTLAVYASLVIARVSHGFRGRRAAWLSVAGFAMLVISFCSVNFFGDTFHAY